jgi:signal peptidase
MKTSVKKILTIEIIMLITILTGFFIPYLFEEQRYMVFLLLAGVATYFAVGFDFRRDKNEKETLKSLVIYLMLFFIASYLFGLFIGFNKTIYSFGLTNLANNIVPTILLILTTEILRYQFIKKSNKNKLVIILSVIIFTGIDICIANTFYNYSVQTQLYEFIGLIVICGITKNILMTVMDMKYDYVVPLAYRLVMDLYEFIVPIVPGFGPYFKSIVMIIFPSILTFVMYKGDEIKTNPKPMELTKNKIAITIVTIVLVFIILLNTGFFKYRTLVIGSDSMKPYISKGDVVLIRKTTAEEQQEFKKGDILAFNSGSKIIVHRIYKIIEKKGNMYFITKGDNNNQVDQGVVESGNVVGKVLLRIKKIGLPSIWLDELFK